ncbi:MAG: DUF6044 family protein [Butyrivibrio sp.]|nr:DUF6044 family protein [Butyrivibrio sp.]
MTKSKLSFGNLIVFLFVISVAVFYCVIGENSHIAVHDNLDLFTAQFAMLKNTDSFFAHGVAAPFLGGVSRDVLPGEFYLTTILYMLFPPFVAYVIAYVIKVLIAVYSCKLLFLDVAKDSGRGADGAAFGRHVENLATLAGLLYGVLNLFPAFGIAFASVPLIVFLLRRLYLLGKDSGRGSIDFKTGRRSLVMLFAAVFLYPVVSYFSYFGFFILGYLFVAVIWLWIRDKKLSLNLVIALILLALGYVVFEYRLFGMMLFSDTVTIRDTMVQTYYPASGILSEIFDVFVNGMMHVEDVHKFFVMPVCLLYFLILNVNYIRKGRAKEIFHDIYNLCALILVFNAVVYGLYFSKGMNSFVELVLPPLKGFQFNRTIFFSPFVWCAMLFIVGCRILTALPYGAYILTLVAIAVVLMSPTRYNDLYRTALLTAKSEVFGNEVDDLNYGEFYSTALFDKIKEDIGYTGGEWAVAYGMHPAVLEYNGIYTLDGYLGFYPEEYKQKFRKIIAPALSRKENSRIYYDEWGARCYLYSGTDDSIVMPTKSMYGVTDTDIYIDTAALKALGGKYLFSRIELSNAGEVGLELIGTYDGCGSPYVIYVYEV